MVGDLTGFCRGVGVKPVCMVSGRLGSNEVDMSRTGQRNFPWKTKIEPLGM